MLILFVCTGNTCRSPMAELIGRQLVAEKLQCRPDQLEDHGVVVLSCGVATGPGGPATHEAVEVMQDFGLDLSAHMTQPISERLVRTADVIYTMTNGHRQAIIQHWPESTSRVHVLRPDGTDVSDPIGGPRDLYRSCAEQIKTAIAERIEQLDLPESTS